MTKFAAVLLIAMIARVAVADEANVTTVIAVQEEALSKKPQAPRKKKKDAQPADASADADLMRRMGFSEEAIARTAEEERAARIDRKKNQEELAIRLSRERARLDPSDAQIAQLREMATRYHKEGKDALAKSVRDAANDLVVSRRNQITLDRKRAVEKKDSERNLRAMQQQQVAEKTEREHIPRQSYQEKSNRGLNSSFPGSLPGLENHQPKFGTDFEKEPEVSYQINRAVDAVRREDQQIANGDPRGRRSSNSFSAATDDYATRTRIERAVDAARREDDNNAKARARGGTEIHSSSNSFDPGW